MTEREKVIEGLEKVWDAFNHMEHELYADYVYDALELLKAQETGGWISVKDRMPEEGDLVLVAFYVDIGLGEIRQVNTAMHIKGKFLGGGLDNFHAFKCVMDFTHWMPLPKPPKEG